MTTDLIFIIYTSLYSAIIKSNDGDAGKQTFQAQ